MHENTKEQKPTELKRLAWRLCGAQGMCFGAPGIWSAYLGLLHGETYVCADGAISVGTTEALKLEARITEKGQVYNRTF